MKSRVSGAAASFGLLAAIGWLLLSAASAEAQPNLDSTVESGNQIAEKLEAFDHFFGRMFVQPVAEVFFFDLAFWDNSSPTDVQVPLVVLWLMLGAIFFTFRFSFINVRAFRHAIAVTAGRFDDESDPGEVSHFQALSSALSATVGLGNIAGVALAVGMGGPGAVLWMIVAAALGMSSKFAECTLGQMYRRVDERGVVSGGPFRYLEHGLADIGRPVLGRSLAVLFALLCIGGSFGGGNMFQANQSRAQLATLVPFFDTGAGKLVYGLALALIVAIVIIGGIRRIGRVAGYVVPFMCAVYVLASIWVLLTHSDKIGWAFGQIIEQAFTPKAGYGGAIGVMMMGFRRAAFSNEAGVGSASIAHAAAATNEPVREGIVALLEPFIDTIIVCTMTALVVVITGAYEQEAEGVVMTSNAFATVLPWFPKVLTVAVLFFAFSTMISWSYYGERSWSYLFGHNEHVSLIYRVIFLGFVVSGAVVKLQSAFDFSDLMILGMAFPNVFGVVLLSGKVRAALDGYMAKYVKRSTPPTAD